TANDDKYVDDERRGESKIARVFRGERQHFACARLRAQLICFRHSTHACHVSASIFAVARFPLPSTSEQICRRLRIFPSALGKTSLTVVRASESKSKHDDRFHHRSAPFRRSFAETTSASASASCCVRDLPYSQSGRPARRSFR